MKKIIYSGIIVTALLFKTCFAHAEFEPPENPDSAKECAICHYNWIDTFYIEHRGSDLVEYQTEKVVAKPDMCFSCHDGSVVDSRARVYNDHRHSTNKPPPKHMRLPKIFPLDEKGNMQCATCHTAHGTPERMSIERSVFLRASNKDSAMCRMCHTDKDGGTETGNHPIDITSSKLEIPEKHFTDRGAHLGTKKNQAICETCHTVHGSPYESFLVESGRESSHLCLECHINKNIFTPEGKRNPFHVINVKLKNAELPAELIKKGSKLGYNGEIICQTCHKMHNNKIEKNLLLAKNNKNFCLTCHTDKQYLSETKHNLMHSAPEEKNLDGKTTAEAGICSPCHLAHKAARVIAGEGDFTTRLCLSCHSKNNIAEKSIPADYSHPVNVKLKRNAEGGKEADISLPLFSGYNVPDKNGEITCITCHDPHRWRPDSTKGEIRKNIQGDKNTSFLRKPSPELCRECHSEKFYITNSKHDLNRIAPKEENILKQTPRESGICATCHLVHGGQKDYLWARNILKSSDAGAILCNSCHSEKGIGKKKLVNDNSHPVNVLLTPKGLSTTLPLFDENGKIAKKGFMSCPTCHEPHRWDPEKIYQADHSAVEGTAKDSFLRISNAPSSGLCSDCHKEQVLVDKTDHDLRITSPGEKNLFGQTPEESGQCGACHIAHNSPTKLKLWAKKLNQPSGAERPMDTLCNSCHSKGNSAGGKIPPIATHPEEKLITNILRNNKEAIDFFPLYDTEGRETSTGNTTCPSCHNVHQWSPLIKQKGAGRPLEGDVTTSFLRNLSYNNICIDCHGLDALFRYKYFHDQHERVETAKPLKK